MTTWTMKMDRKYIIRRRIAFVLALALAVVLLIGFYQITSRIWWVDWNEGYCFGTMEQCFPEMFGGK